VSGSPRIAVLGGGPAGLGAAYAAACAGLPVTLYERAPQVGGLARSFELWGQTVELGAHLLLREDPRIDRLWTELIGDAYDRVPRQTRIVTDGRWLRYPYEPLDVVRQLGLGSSLRCAHGAVQRRRPRSGAAGTLEGWIVERFGQPAFELLVAGDVQKLFGRPARELDAQLAGSLLGFQRRPTIARTVGRAVRRVPEPPLVRPHDGVGTLAERLAEAVVARGGCVVCGREVGRLEIDGRRVRGIEIDGRIEPVDRVISTLPLPALFERLPDAPPEIVRRLRGLTARSVVIAYALLDGPPPFSGQWVYVADPRPVSRITSFSGWTPPGSAPPPQSILAFELWCDAGDATWEQPPDVFRAVAERTLADLGLRHAPVLDVAVRRGRDVLPVLSPAARTTVAEAGAWLRRIDGLHTTGRHGSFANSGVHESLLLGVEAGRALALGGASA
jgi:protoporphyrinogen oxidase